MTRCVCGRSVRVPWRFYRAISFTAAALVWGLLIARHDRDTKADRRRAHSLGDSLRVRLDSIRGGRWVQLRSGDTIVSVIRGRTYRWRGAH